MRNQCLKCDRTQTVNKYNTLETSPANNFMMSTCVWSLFFFAGRYADITQHHGMDVGSRNLALSYKKITTAWTCLFLRRVEFTNEESLRTFCCEELLHTEYHRRHEHVATEANRGPLWMVAEKCKTLDSQSSERTKLPFQTHKLETGRAALLKSVDKQRINPKAAISAQRPSGSRVDSCKATNQKLCPHTNQSAFAQTLLVIIFRSSRNTR